MEKFLCKQVSCVITDKPVHRQPSSILASPVVALHRTHGSSRNGRSISEKYHPITRGEELLAKSKAAEITQRRCDVLANARSLGIQIASTVAVKKLIAENSASGGWHVNSNAGGCSKQLEATKPHHSEKLLSGNFVKFEDESGKWRPQHKEFAKWPMKFFLAGLGSARIERTAPMTAGKQKAMQPGYCECCEINYSNLEFHLNDENHRSFAADLSNYACVDDVIEQCQSFSDFLLTLNQDDTSANIEQNDTRLPDSISEVKQLNMKTTAYQYPIKDKEQRELSPDKLKEDCNLVPCRVNSERKRSNYRQKNREFSLLENDSEAVSLPDCNESDEPGDIRCGNKCYNKSRTFADSTSADSSNTYQPESTEVSNSEMIMTNDDPTMTHRFAPTMDINNDEMPLRNIKKHTQKSVHSPYSESTKRAPLWRVTMATEKSLKLIKTECKVNIDAGTVEQWKARITGDCRVILSRCKW